MPLMHTDKTAAWPLLQAGSCEYWRLDQSSLKQPSQIGSKLPWHEGYWAAGQQQHLRQLIKGVVDCYCVRAHQVQLQPNAWCCRGPTCELGNVV